VPKGAGLLRRELGSGVIYGGWVAPERVGFRHRLFRVGSS
jgi:hypothetical protein